MASCRGSCGVECTEVLPVAGLPVPGFAQRLGLQPEVPQGAFVRCRHGPQDADFAFEHQRGGGHSGHQRDLGVPVLHRELRSRGDPVAAVGKLDDLLLGHVQAGAVAFAFQLNAFEAHFLQELKHR